MKRRSNKLPKMKVIKGYYFFMNHRDELTNAMNRAAFISCLTEKLKDAHAKNTNLAVLCVDIDNMKHFNMHNGHTLGDEMLKRFVVIVEPLLRSSYLLFRIGGDEFAIILTNMNREEILYLAQKICDISRRELSPPQPNNCGDPRCMGPAKISVSIGIAESRDDSTLEALWRKAEEKQSEAKCAGRDCIRI
jgi:diguanylate cyclase (GGDEF)-like protein